jgi:hypothetical protein
MIARLSSIDTNPTYNNPITSLDARTKAAKRLENTRRDLIRHLGRVPNPLEESLISRVCVLSARVVELEARMLRGVGSPEDNENLLILVNNLHALLQSLGWKSNPMIDNSGANYAVLNHPPNAA